jgi:hypothetical protein
MKPLEVQFNSQDTFGYMPLSKESCSSYIKFSKSGKSGKKVHPQTYLQGTIYEGQQDMCYSSRNALGNQTHRKRDKN